MAMSAMHCSYRTFSIHMYPGLHRVVYTSLLMRNAGVLGDGDGKGGGATSLDRLGSVALQPTDCNVFMLEFVN